METAWKLGIYDTGDPVHHEELPSGKLPGLFQHRDRVFHVADPVQQRNLKCMLSSQHSDGAQIQRLLSVREARFEFLQPRGEKLCTLAFEVRVRILRHEQKQQLWISRRWPGKLPQPVCSMLSNPGPQVSLRGRFPAPSQSGGAFAFFRSLPCAQGNSRSRLSFPRLTLTQPCFSNSLNVRVNVVLSMAKP